MAALLLAAALAPTATSWPLAVSAQHLSGLTAAVQKNKAERLPGPGEGFEREIKGGESHFYRVALSAGQFLRVALEPQGIDLLVVTLSGTATAKLDSFERRSDAPVQEPIALVVEISGTYTFEVRSPARASGVGRYRIEVEELRPSDARDRNRVAAERAFARGAQMQFAQGGAGSLRSAVVRYEEALALWRSIADRAGESRALGSIGNVYSSLGEPRRAIDYYRQKLDIVRGAGDGQQEAFMLETIGWLYHSPLGDKQSSLEFLGRAHLLYRAAGRREAEARTLTALGKVYAELGETPDEKRKSLDFHAEAMGIYRAAKNPYYEGDSLSNLMAAWKSLNVPRRAIFFGKQAVNTFQEIRSNIKGLEKDTQQTFLKSKEETYRTLADLLIAEGRLAEAQQVLSMLKEEEYFEFIRRDGDDTPALTKRATRTPEEVEWEKRYREIADQLTTRGRERGELYKKAARTPEDDRRLAQLDEDLTFANEAFQKFLDRLSGELGGPAAEDTIKLLKEAEGLKEDLRELGSGAVALYTLVGKEHYRVILVTPDVQRAFEYKIGAADLGRKIVAFREVLQNPRLDPLPLARELFTILVGPVAKDLKDAGAETLMWSLDGVLRYVPMAALHDGEKYMVERYRNVIFTPASNARLKDLPSEKWTGAGFGVSKAHGDLGALPAVPEELRAIINDGEAGGVVSPGVLEGKILLDDTFTEEGMKALLRQRYPVVHIASHFIFQPGDEANSYLLLGDGRRLSLSQIKTSVSFGGVELLTLSACDTATGGAGADGKEVEGFAVLAQRRGAKSVVASLWPVADASTQLLMQSFYRVRDAQPGLTKGEALRQAQLSLLNGGPAGAAAKGRREAGAGADPGRGLSVVHAKTSFRHPYFWAPFILIGNWR